MENNECLFCKIINGDIPANKVYEDAFILAFLDINPVSPGHTLVTPKKHSVNILDTDEDILVKLSLATKKISKAILDALDYEDFNLEVNNGKNAGQVIPHAHWHIIPRREGDGLKPWPHKEYKEGQANEVADKIIKSII